MKDLGDIQWIFAKTNNISDLQTLKAKVIEALKTADGKPIDVVLNSLGVISRMNLGQLFESQLGLIAHELGVKFAVPTF